MHSNYYLTLSEHMIKSIAGPSSFESLKKKKAVSVKTVLMTDLLVFQ